MKKAALLLFVLGGLIVLCIAATLYPSFIPGTTTDPLAIQNNSGKGTNTTFFGTINFQFVSYFSNVNSVSVSINPVTSGVNFTTGSSRGLTTINYQEVLPGGGGDVMATVSNITEVYSSVISNRISSSMGASTNTGTVYIYSMPNDVILFTNNSKGATNFSILSSTYQPM